MSGVGSAALRRYRTGKRLTRAQAILAKCADCCGDYSDGRIDCGIGQCPLYPWHPYRERRRKTLENMTKQGPDGT
jgi:hypothetical protein